MQLDIENISENIANDIVLFDVKILSNSKEDLWDKKSAIHLDTIQANDKATIYLGNPALTEDNCCFKMKMNTYLIPYKTAACPPIRKNL